MKKLVIGILAHVDAGKTTLSEAMLYTSGAIRSLGRVDHQDAFLDTDSQERARGITIFSKQAEFEFGNMKVQLLDTPGILWPKVEDPEVGMMLAYTGAVKEGVIDIEELSCRLMELLHKFYPQTLLERYKVEAPAGTPGWELMEMAGRKRGYLVSGGEVNTERMAKVLLDEFRGGKLGKFTLEMPEEDDHE